MRATNPTDRNEEFSGAIQDFRRWRRTRPRGARIPRALWQAAMSLADRHGVSRTAAALGLDYYSLKKRLLASLGDAAQAATGGGRPTQFVELPLSSVTSSVTCAVEVERWIGDRGHSKLRLELEGVALSEVGALLHSIWSPDA